MSIHFYYDIINIQISRGGDMLAGGRKSRNPVSSFVSLVVWVAVLHVSCN